MSKKTEVIVCRKCKGLGEIYWQELTDYHKGDYVTHSNKCEYCDGRGVMIRTTVIKTKPITNEDMQTLGYNYQKFGH